MGHLAEDLSSEATSDDTRIATLSKDWSFFGPNGGYIAALALRAGVSKSTFEYPVSFCCQFLNGGQFAPVELTVKSLRKSRVLEALSIVVTQDSKTLLTAQLWCSDLTAGPVQHDFTACPTVRKPEECPTYDETIDPRIRFGFWDNVELRLTNPRTDPQRPDVPFSQNWSRFRPCPVFEEPSLNAGRALIMLDVVSIQAGTRAYPTMPLPFLASTLALSVQFIPSALVKGADDGWLLIDASTPIAKDSLLPGIVNVFNHRGGLVATGSAQTFIRPLPAMAGGGAPA